MTTPTLEVRRVTRSTLPRVPFVKIAARALPRGYKLSLVLCADTLARRVYRQSRAKKKPNQGSRYAPNILSFPLQKREGEIFLNVRKAEREAKAYGVKKEVRIAHLFAHGCLHLSGHTHGRNMDRLEKTILASVGFRVPYLS